MKIVYIWFSFLLVLRAAAETSEAEYLQVQPVFPGERETICAYI